MKTVSIKKLSELPDAKHPNNIDVGYERQGNFIAAPEVGECFWVGHEWRTSTVVEILSEHTFKTRNSIYHWKAE